MSHPQYTTVCGTSYSKLAQAIGLADVLERLRQRKDRVRVRIHYSWGDSEEGYIGRSCGSLKVPLLVHNARSLGGTTISDAHVVKVEYSNKRNGGTIWSLDT